MALPAWHLLVAVTQVESHHSHRQTRAEESLHSRTDSTTKSLDIVWNKKKSVLHSTFFSYFVSTFLTSTLIQATSPPPPVLCSVSSAGQVFIWDDVMETGLCKDVGTTVSDPGLSLTSSVSPGKIPSYSQRLIQKLLLPVQCWWIYFCNKMNSYKTKTQQHSKELTAPPGLWRHV